MLRATLREQGYRASGGYCPTGLRYTEGVRWFVVAIVLVFAQDVIAEPAPRERAAVVAIDLGPNVPPYVRAKATTQIEEGLATSGYVVLPTSEVGPRLAGALAICREGACVRSVVQALGVDAAVFVSITRKDESSVITMRLYDAESAQRTAEVHDVCDLCGESELIDRLGVAASALHAQAIEGRERRARLAAQSKPVEIAPPPPHPEESRSLVPGLVTAATGAVALGVGIYLIAIDGRGTCTAGDQPVYPAPGAVIRYPDPADPGTFICRDIYKTKTLGIVGAGVGLAAVALGVTLVIHARHRDHAVEIAPTAGGATLKVSLSW